jgi:hypothetical protein
MVIIIQLDIINLTVSNNAYLTPFYFGIIARFARIFIYILQLICIYYFIFFIIRSFSHLFKNKETKRNFSYYFLMWNSPFPLLLLRK